MLFCFFFQEDWRHAKFGDPNVIWPQNEFRQGLVHDQGKKPMLMSEMAMFADTTELDEGKPSFPVRTAVCSWANDVEAKTTEPAAQAFHIQWLVRGRVQTVVKSSKKSSGILHKERLPQPSWPKLSRIYLEVFQWDSSHNWSLIRCLCRLRCLLVEDVLHGNHQRLGDVFSGHPVFCRVQIWSDVNSTV